MESKHTPGPWTTDDSLADEAGEFGIAILAKWQDGSAVRVADCPVGEVDPETYANARLIAAAPDLLAALRDLVENINDPTCSIDELRNDVSFADSRAAIARATGGES